MLDRRMFLAQSAATASLLLGAAATRASSAVDDVKSLKILFLGGTGFIGPHHVRAAVERGHQVTIFNRGQSRAELPTNVERLIGDRAGDLKAIRNREWDAVVDLATVSPAWIRTIADALRRKVGHYTFISTGAVYAYLPVSQTPYVEEHPTVNYPGDGNADPIKPPTTLQEYGGLKRLCELEAERQFPDRTLILRPGYITGPGDAQDHLLYWPLRVERGGDVLVGGDPSLPTQFVDVRDMAQWSLRLIEQRATGILNVVDRPLSLANLVQTARDVLSSAASARTAQLTWVPWTWLDKRPDKELWQKVLFWPFDSDGSAGRMNMSYARALEQGLTPRPVSVTMRDTLAWFLNQPPTRQAQVLPRIAPSSSERVDWASYVKREGQLLAEWRAQKAQ